jgi:neutral ceramidase
MKPGSIPPNPFGERTDRIQMNPPRNNANLLEPAGPVDPQLSILAVQHADGRPLAMLANYGLHYVGGYRNGHVSADYFAAFSERIQARLQAKAGDPPFVAMMSNGTSGDVNNINFREPPTGAAPPWTRIREVADDLADKALAVYEQLNYQDRPTIGVRTTELGLGVRQPSPERLAWAKRTVEGIEQGKPLSRPQVYASEAFELAKFPARVPLKLQAIRIGELGIAAVPCEVFAETGLAIKQQSPLRSTFTIELANGYNGYLPTPQQHELGGYETWPARSAYLEPQAEPQIRAKVLDLLRQTAEA